MNKQQAFSLVPNATAASAVAYTIPKGLISANWVLDANEGPPLSENWSSLVSECRLNRYPSRESLTKELAAYYQRDQNQVLVTAGGDDAIDRVCRSMLSPEREIIFPIPSFDIVASLARASGATVREVPWHTAEYPVQAVMDQVTPKTAVIAVISPNNPSGGVITADGLRELSRFAPHALLLVDLAYTEFADQDLTAVALTLPNAVVIRTFSKAWGLAGLRVGYAIGPAPVIAWMNAMGHPYPTSQLSLDLAESFFLSKRDEMSASVSRARNERSILESFFQRKGIEFSPSQGNFVFLRPPNAHFLWEVLASFGFAVRRFSASEHPIRKELQHWLRISCPGDEHALKELQSILEKALSPQLLLIPAEREILLALSPVLPDFAKRIPLALLQLGDDREGAQVIPDELPFSLIEGSVPLIDEKAFANRQAWMIATDSKSIAKARSAGIVTLGWSPTMEPSHVHDLQRSGAARVLSTTAQILEILP